MSPPEVSIAGSKGTTLAGDLVPGVAELLVPSKAATNSQKGILAFLAQDGEKRFFCYANAEVRKEDQNDEVLRFVEFWKQRTGELPDELIFDSKLTTHRNLSELNRIGVQFITLRRRGPKLVEEIAAPPIRLATHQPDKHCPSIPDPSHHRPSDFARRL